MQEIRHYQVTNTDFRRMQTGSSDLSYSDMICVQCLSYLFSKILLGLLPNSNKMPQVSQKPSKLGRGLRAHFVCVCMHPQENLIPSCSRACSSQDASLIRQSTQNTEPWDTSQSGRSQVNNSNTTSSRFLLLTSNILHINSTGFFSWKDRAHNKNNHLKKPTRKPRVNLQRAKLPLS